MTEQDFDVDLDAGIHIPTEEKELYENCSSSQISSLIHGEENIKPHFQSIENSGSSNNLRMV